MVKSLIVIATIPQEDVVDFILSNKMPALMKIDKFQNGVATATSPLFPVSNVDGAESMFSEIPSKYAPRIEERISTRQERRTTWGE